MLCFPAAILLIVLSMSCNGFAEGYATTVYPILSKLGNLLFAALPFSMAEILVILLLPVVLTYLIFCIISIKKSKGKGATALRVLMINPLCAVGTLLLVFLLCCGINYYRDSFAETSGLPIQDSSRQEVAILYDELVKQANTQRSSLETDSEGNLINPSIDALRETAQASFDKMEAEYPTLKSGYSAPKLVLLSRGMSWCGISGVFFPFTFEANVNADIPAFTIPSTMCHELTHLRGYMREDEANFISYLACRNSDSPYFQYSGTLLALIHTGNALYGADPDTYFSLNAGLNDGVLQDLSVNNQYWQQFEGPVSDVASSVNDAYLKANQQQDGVQSYGRMVDLLLADYRARHS